MNKNEDINQPTEEQLAEEQQLKTEGAETDETTLEAQVEEQPVDELTSLKNELNDIKDKHLRLVAEFDNFRKRTLKERIELIQTSNQELMAAVLPVIDDFERAAKSMEALTELAPVKEGMDLIHQKLKNILIQKGLKPLDSLGQPFNADLHESIANIPAPSEDQKNLVLDEVERGYMLGEKVIRFAKVVVGG
ncbi:MAG: nucleotide exchange factor GrpE [Flavobacteriaceae bacterium]|nr:nucleotide exchange factor GrpE [Flavobacteriaceae bacterium]